MKWRALAAFVIFATFRAAPALADETSITVGVKQNVSAYLFTPGGPGPYPGILLLHTSGGLVRPDIAYAQRLVGQNYVVLVPAYMAPYGISNSTPQITFTTFADPIYADLVAALNTLEHNPKVAGRKLGAIGFSNGGFFAIWLAATNKVAAGVGYYGAYDGVGSDRNLNRFRAAFNRNSAPVLILHGMDDHAVKVIFAENLADIVKSAGSPYEIKLYDGAGHVFERVGGPQNAAAAADAWLRAVAFFGKYLQ